MPDFAQLSIAQITQGYARGDFTPVHYAGYCLQIIKAKNPEINAFLDVYNESAHVAALRSKQRWLEGKPLSAIDGVPIAVKANIAVEGQVCHGGIKAYAGSIAPKDADVITRLKRAGCIILGSVNMEEGALGAQTDNPFFGKTHNPLKSGYTPGGSSGGSAAAVAAGFVPAALGTDTMGSVRIPSAYCGLTGYKPSRVHVPSKGVMPLSTTLDTVGIHARNLEDMEAFTPILSNSDWPADLSPAQVQRYAVMATPNGTIVDDDVADCFAAALRKLQALGSSFSRADDVFEGYDAGAYRRAGLLISEAEGAAYHKAMLANNPDGFSPHFTAMLAYGARQSAQKMSKAYAAIADVSEMAEQVFNAKTDFIIAPTAPQTAFRFGDPVPANQADFTAFANFADLPAITIPIGIGKNGMPIGLQIIGARRAHSTSDVNLFSFARQCQAVLSD